MKRITGFTLIELVLVMVVISVGFLGLARLFANTNTGLSSAETVQVAAQYAQECAERVLAARREPGFAWTSLNNAMCDGITGLPVPYVRGLNIVPTTGTCPNLATCKDVTVTVTPGSNPPTVILFTLVQY
jgi:prepilin-type N-terminal cleavage/methylation domain-containing protein